MSNEVNVIRSEVMAQPAVVENLLVQEFPCGVVRYEVVKGVVISADNISIVHGEISGSVSAGYGSVGGKISTDIKREVWVRWEDPNFADMKLVCDMIKDQRVMMVNAHVSNHDG